MAALNEFLIHYGYLGMLLAAFLAGSFIPFSSEVVLVTLLTTTTMNAPLTVLSACVGNWAGSMFNYAIGRLGSAETIARWLKVKPERLEQAQRWTQRWGAWAALVTFLPIIGSAISIALGIMRTNVWKVSLATFAGKSLRYIFIAYTVIALNLQSAAAN